MPADEFVETHVLRQQIEWSIKSWVNRTYKRRIGVSVQVLYYRQGNERLFPDNPICRNAYRNAKTKDKCDRSDLAMKLICAERGNGTAIAYRCHRGLSNIVVPCPDANLTKRCWYIFLGQFVIGAGAPCIQCQAPVKLCPAHNRLLENANIVQADSDDIKLVPSEDQSTVKIRLFSVPPAHWPSDCTLDIVQLLACKTMALHIFEEEFARAMNDPKVSANLRSFAEKYTTPPAPLPLAPPPAPPQQEPRDRVHPMRGSS